MTLTVSKVDGVAYDNSEPRFVVIGDKPDEFCFDRVEHRIVTKASVIAAGATAEIGAGSAAFLAGMMLEGVSLADYVKGLTPAPITPPPAATPITATAAATGTTSATITFAAGPQVAAGTVTISGLASGAKAVTGLTAIATAAGDTAAVIAGKVAAAINNKKDATSAVTFSAAAVGPVVTITGTGGGNIDAGLAAAVT